VFVKFVASASFVEGEAADRRPHSLDLSAELTNFGNARKRATSGVRDGTPKRQFR
jgi:hypothetical protein